jgi:hypothetical protein
LKGFPKDVYQAEKQVNFFVDWKKKKKACDLSVDLA